MNYLKNHHQDASKRSNVVLMLWISFCTRLRLQKMAQSMLLQITSLMCDSQHLTIKLYSLNFYWFLKKITVGNWSIGHYRSFKDCSTPSIFRNEYPLPCARNSCTRPLFEWEPCSQDTTTSPAQNEPVQRTGWPSWEHRSPWYGRLGFIITYKQAGWVVDDQLVDTHQWRLDLLL